ncbi:MAG: hypothetical protein IKQ10_06940 [Oscillospiraceae bacterium]|nr:hypothetical protein [Oscillospiraceae bacterium]
MIPKTIHYCWFGRNEKSDSVLRCIESWRRILPDYEIAEWNEDNYDVHICRYTSEAYDRQKWAFVADHARLTALYRYGGLYFDTDMEVLRPFDVFLDNEAFAGYEANDMLQMGAIGAVPENALIGEFLAYYGDKSFLKPDGSPNMLAITSITTRILREHGFVPDGREALVDGMRIYPQIYFCPNNLSRIWGVPSPRSYTVHHADSSWRPTAVDRTTLKGRIIRYGVGVLRNRLGSDGYARLSRKLRGHK